MVRHDDVSAAFGHTVPLAAVRDDLEAVEAAEALEREVAARSAKVRMLLSPEQVRSVWALRDAEQRLALAEQDLREHSLVDGLARHLPEHAPTVHALAAQFLDGR